jgi:WhiB family transcriptional regulator, redox-sensing transcriptional regulator
MVDWRRRADCRGCDPDVFHPDPRDYAATKAAKAVCRECPVRRSCLEEALSEPQTFNLGVRGGLTFHQRARLRVRRRVVAA